MRKEFLAVAKLLEIEELFENEPKSRPETSIGNFEEQKGSSDHIKKKAKQDKRQRIENLKFGCDECHKTYSSRGGLHVHKQSVHNGVEFPCDQCDFRALYPSDLTRHIQSRHEGVKYACDQCDSQFTQQSHLTIHIKSKHDGIKYACDQCDYQAITQSHLAVHFQSQH